MTGTKLTPYQATILEKTLELGTDGQFPDMTLEDWQEYLASKGYSGEDLEEGTIAIAMLLLLVALLEDINAT